MTNPAGQGWACAEVANGRPGGADAANGNAQGRTSGAGPQGSRLTETMGTPQPECFPEGPWSGVLTYAAGGGNKALAA